MHRTYLEVLLEHVGITKAQLGRRLGWTPQRINYLTGESCRGFPFDELWYVKNCLNLTDKEQLLILDEYFKQYRGNRGKDNVAVRGK